MTISSRAGNELNSSVLVTFIDTSRIRIAIEMLATISMSMSDAGSGITITATTITTAAGNITLPALLVSIRPPWPVIVGLDVLGDTNQLAWIRVRPDRHDCSQEATLVEKLNRAIRGGSARNL